MAAKSAGSDDRVTKDAGAHGSDGTGEQPAVTPKDAEAAAHRFKRGGFAPETTSKDEIGTVLEPAVVATKKRKRQIDDPDDKEERAAKRVERAQQSYALSKYQDIALRPPESLTIAAVQEKYGLPTLLEDCKTSHLLPTSIGLQTVVGVWTSIRLQEPRRRIFPRVEWSCAHAYPPSDKDPAVADPVLYLREGVTSGLGLEDWQLSADLLMIDTPHVRL
ncbi:hypothetical protein FRC10_011009 [Ceratobasidium sp. 414]|nr:hypothetical protein FRC10_011009 [Ceratobasidium sp. 414]